MSKRDEREGRRNGRPGSVDANDTTGIQSIGVGILHVGQVPPYFVHTREHGEERGEQHEWSHRECRLGNHTRFLYQISGVLSDKQYRPTDARIR
jgi:hypothetical protein